MNMKILYASAAHDPLDINSGSGSDFQFHQAFLRAGADVHIVGPFKDNADTIEKIYRKFHSLFTNRRYAKYSEKFLTQNTHFVTMAIREINPDFIFVRNLAPIVKLQTNIPIVYCLDTTLKGSQEQWPIFSQLEYLRMLQWERIAVKKSNALITYSKWSRDILVDYYKADPEKVMVMPIPASFPPGVSPEFEQKKPPTQEKVNLLLVGKDSYRKGIDIAQKIVQSLNSSGFRASLKIVGTEGKDSLFTNYHGYFDKSNQEQLSEYLSFYQWAHILIHPARFEAAGIVPSEAAAFGVPTITNNAGGLATTVEDGISGIVLPSGSNVEKYCDEIINLIKNPIQYTRLSNSTRQRYDKELNWRIAGENMVRFITKSLSLT